MEEKNIILQAISNNDIAFINELRNDWENKKMTLGIRFPISYDSDVNWYERICTDHSNKNVFFMIKYKDSNQNIGLVQLVNIDWINRFSYVGIQIIKSEYGKGIGATTINLIVEYAFKVLNLRKILAEIVAYNVASTKMFEKCHFVVTGILKKHIYYDNDFHDLMIYSRSNDKLE